MTSNQAILGFSSSFIIDFSVFEYDVYTGMPDVEYTTELLLFIYNYIL